MIRPRILALASILSLAACGGGYGGGMSPSYMASPSSKASASPMIDTDTLATDTDPTDATSILKGVTETTIGSTVDPVNGAVNPYGLAIAPESRGAIHAGDLVVCNFNDNANVQGTGESVIALAPQPGSTPRAISESANLLGCNALDLTAGDSIWTANFAAKNVTELNASGAVTQTLSGSPFANPFGMIAAQRFGRTVLYASDATNGTIVRISAGPLGTPLAEVIASGFAVNGGAPGSILGPSGLAYDAQRDRLYVVDGTNNAVIMLRHVSTIQSNGIVMNANGGFGGPFSHRGRLVFSGAPLNGPISSALLPNGNLAIGNTLDPNGTNLIVELTPQGKVLDVKNVDTGAAGAIFGMVASGTRDDTQLYFNDDNANAVMLLRN